MSRSDANLRLCGRGTVAHGCAGCAVEEDTRSCPMTEETLSGGFVNATVVRVGDSVRRKAGVWTPTIHRLLRHVRERGVAWVPEPRGLDECGREVLAFIPGEVPHAMPAWIWSGVVLAEVAAALRQWHDATVGFEPGGAVWNFAAHEPAEVVCHNDFAPYNCVFRDGRFVGAIDFDFCSPGPRLRDLAYTAYRFVPLMPPEGAACADGPAGERSPFPERELGARLDCFLETYAAGPVRLRYPAAELLRAVGARLREIADWTEGHCGGKTEHPLGAKGAMYRAHARWIEERADRPEWRGEGPFTA